MLTFFTTAKPFRGHDGLIQQNALRSWKQLRPDVEIILFGDEEGAAEIARGLGIRHEPQVERSESGAKRLDRMFARAQEMARHELLCYINCDIILMPDFCAALGHVKAKHGKFLVVGRRWDVEINKSCKFETKDWEKRLREQVLREGKRRTPDWIDCFVFARSLYGAEFPSLVVGRVFWDNWLVWKALDERCPVVDVSNAVMAVHQNHDYGYHPQGRQGVFYGLEAGRNYELAGGWKHLRTIADATERLGESELTPNRLRYWAGVKRHARQAVRVLFFNGIQRVWFSPFLGLTRPALHVRPARGEFAALAREGVTVRGETRMKAPYFTVLIDAYNYGQYIEEAVSSVLAPDFPQERREILVVDNGSTDDTAARLRRYGDAIRVLRKPNGGQASAFNYGFEHARGEVIALLDADDVWLPGKLGRVYEAFERNPDAGMVYHRVYWWSGASESAADFYFIPVSGRVPESRQALLRYPMASTSCLAFRRTALEKLLSVPEALRSQADAFLTALIIFQSPVVAISEYHGKYRLHGANLFQTAGKEASRKQIEHRMAMRATLLVEIENWLKRNGHDIRTADLRAYLMQWKKAQEQDGFALKAPARWKYFRHLLGFPWTYGEIMTKRHRVYGYLRAHAALVLGYHHLHLLDDARRKRKEWIGSFSEKPMVAVKAKAKAAAATKT